MGVASILAAAVNFTACSSSSSGSKVGGNGASAGDMGAAASNSGGNLNIGMGGSSAGGAQNTGGLTNSCAADVSTAKLVPLDMYIMLDISSSMLEMTSTKTSKWDDVKAALETFLKDSSSAGLGVGLQYFPLLKPGAPSSCTDDAACGDSGPCFLKFCRAVAAAGFGLVPCSTGADCPTGGGPCTDLTECSLSTDYVCPTVGADCGQDDANNELGKCQLATTHSCEHATSCDVATYATPAEPIATLPGAAAALIKSIDATKPSGNTPTAAALGGAIQQATTWAKAHPDHRVVAVIATDGLPTECDPTDINQVGAIAAKGLAANPSIDTFVIGVFGAADVAAGAPDNLDTIAKDGGTKSAFIVDTTKDVTMQFLAALDTIRGAKLDCAFQIPQPSSGEVLDYSQVNVQVSVTGQPDTLLYYVGSASKCDATTGGWYYDSDPAVSNPKQIIACPTSCTAFQAAKDASVKIALGCQTIVK